MANFSPLTAEIGLPVWGTPGNFNRFCILPLLLQRRLLRWYSIYTFLGALAPDGILPGAKFTLRPSLAFSYIGSVTARYSSSGHQPNFAAYYKEWNYATFTYGTTYNGLGGHHVGLWPTF